MSQPGTERELMTDKEFDVFPYIFLYCLSQTHTSTLYIHMYFRCLGGKNLSFPVFFFSSTYISTLHTAVLFASKSNSTFYFRYSIFSHFRDHFWVTWGTKGLSAQHEMLILSKIATSGQDSVPTRTYTVTTFLPMKRVRHVI